MALCSIIGSGKVGSTTAFCLAQRGLCDIKLIDIKEKLPQGEALDILHSMTAVDVSGSQDFSDIEGSDIIINTAGFPRTIGMDRSDLLKKNAEVTQSVANKIASATNKGIIIQVSNPVDVMTYLMREITKFPKNRVMGMGSLLDCQRFAYYLSKKLDTKPSKLNALVIGEHGKTMTPVFSSSYYDGSGATVDGILGEKDKEEITEQIRSSGSNIIDLKGSSSFSPASSIIRMVEAILKKGEFIPVSAYLDGEYGLHDICIGVPAIIGKNGIERIVEIMLQEEELKSFTFSAHKIEKTIKEVKPNK